MAKKKRRPAPAGAPAIPRRLLAALAEAERLISRGRAGQALEILRSLDQIYPNRVEVLSELLNAYHQLKDYPQYLPVCERLVRLRPHDADLALVLAGAYMLNFAPVQALLAFQRFLERWPEHDRANEARKAVAELEPGLRRDLAAEGFTGDEGLELAAMHEEARSLLGRGQYAQARRVAEGLLRRRSDFVPALNNISLTYRVEGDLEAAIATSQRVLAFDPNNLHALANLVQYSCLRGRMDEAREWASRLQAVESTNPDAWTKKAEALTYLGDDQGVLEAFEGAERMGEGGQPQDRALLYHLAAVAALRRGDEAQARQRWQRALKPSPGMDLAQENLADLRQPIGQRHAPWPFSFAQWVPHAAIRELASQSEAASRQGSEGAITRAVQRYLRQHPEFATLIPLLLERGDPQGRTFALMVAKMAGTPEMLAALRDFALSQRGPDRMRTEAAQAAMRAGLLPSGPVRMWVEGEWREVMALGFDIHGDEVHQHSPQVEEWMAAAVLALRRGDGKRAEALVRQALEIEPDAPDAVNNLAAAYEIQGRMAEAEALTAQNFERHPDYLFGRTSMAQLYVRDGKIEEAEALLEPLLTRQRFHHLEFAAFCNAQIELYLAQGKREGVESWLKMWAAVDPDNPAIARLRRSLGRRGR